MLPLSHTLPAFCNYVSVKNTGILSYRILLVFTLQMQEATAKVFHYIFNYTRTQKVKQILPLPY